MFSRIQRYSNVCDYGDVKTPFANLWKKKWGYFLCVSKYFILSHNVLMVLSLTAGVPSVYTNWFSTLMSFNPTQASPGIWAAEKRQECQVHLNAKKFIEFLEKWFHDKFDELEYFLGRSPVRKLSSSCEWKLARWACSLLQWASASCQFFTVSVSNW